MAGESKRDTARRRIAEKRAAEVAARTAAERRRRVVVGAVVAAVVLVVAVVVVIAVQSGRTAVSADAAVPANTIDGGDVVLVGSATAPVTIDLYEDLQCPVCRQFEQSAGATMAQLVAAGTVQLHYHPMAFLDSGANQQYSTRALNAAAAVLDAAGPDAFQEFHDLLYADQPPESGPGLTDDQLVDSARQAGADSAAVAQQISDGTYEDWTRRVTDQASKDGVTATPTVLVDGEELAPDQLTADGISAAVQAATPAAD